MKPQAQNTELEFSHTIAVDKIPATGITISLTPTAEQRAALAKRFALLDLTKLQAEIVVRRANLTDGISVTGTFVADVVQQCGVTLESLPAHIDNQIDAIFIDSAPAEGEEGGEGLDLALDEGDVELIEKGFIDLGELLAQNLGISLDPYPRKPGLDPVTIELGTPPQSENPFAKLAEWKKKPKDNG